MSKPIQVGSHRQLVEAAKTDGRQTCYEHINKIGFEEAWKIAADMDPGLPPELVEAIPDEARRAVITLAREVLVLRYEWS